VRESQEAASVNLAVAARVSRGHVGERELAQGGSHTKEDTGLGPLRRAEVVDTAGGASIAGARVRRGTR
jgi:hypothetical protein